MAAWWVGSQLSPMTWEQYLGLDGDTRRDIEIVDGVVVPSKGGHSLVPRP